MNESSDDLHGHVLLVLAGIVAAVLLGVLVIAIRSGSAHSAAFTRTAPGRPVVPEAASGDPPRGAIVFSAGSIVLPDNAERVLAPIVAAVRADISKVVLVSSVPDGEAASDGTASLAGKRVQVVLHALEADGVPANQLSVDRPGFVQGKARDGRRVAMQVH